MSLYANRYNAFFVSNQELKQISIVLKNGKTIQSKVMDLIFTILGCIVLHIDDHCTRLHEFKDVFNSSSLTSLRNDLENLLYFDTKFFNCLILELMLHTLQKESNYLDRRIQLGANGIVSRRRWNGVIIQRKVKAIVKFLIFRKTRTCRCLHDEDDTLNSYKNNISIVLNNEISRTNVFEKNIIVFDKNKYSKYFKNNYQKDIMDQICFKRNDTNNLQNRSVREYNLYEASKYVYIQRFCNNTYCLLRCGWLWLSLYYFTMFFVQFY